MNSLKKHLNLDDAATSEAKDLIYECVNKRRDQVFRDSLHKSLALLIAVLVIAKVCQTDNAIPCICSISSMILIQYFQFY